MNQIDGTSIAGRDERRLDLLVDGELSEEDRRALLRLLDREPGGWRRCALAFLEAQAWKRELPALLDSSGGEPGPAEPRRRWWWSRHAGTAAGHGRQLPVALTLGMTLVAGMKWPSVTDDREPPRRIRAPAAASPWQMVTVADRGSGRAAPQTFQVPASSRSARRGVVAKHSQAGFARRAPGAGAERPPRPAAAGVAPRGDERRAATGRAGGPGGHPLCRPAEIVREGRTSGGVSRE